MKVEGKNEYRTIPIGKLKPYPNNPRRNDKAVDAVAKSITAYGFRAPVVVDERFEILAGHTRYKAAKRLGLDEVPCVVCHGLTPSQKIAYRIADNKIGELAQWDMDALNEEIGKIDWDEIKAAAGVFANVGELGLDSLGFSDFEADGLALDADVGAMLDDFENGSPVRERESKRANDDGENGKGDMVTFTARGKYEDFGEDFWTFAAQLYARGIKTNVEHE